MGLGTDDKTGCSPDEAISRSWGYAIFGDTAFTDGCAAKVWCACKRTCLYGRQTEQPRLDYSITIVRTYVKYAVLKFHVFDMNSI